MQLAHSTFWPHCSCCWLLGYGVDEVDKNRWAQKMTVWDPQCPEHPSNPRGNREENR
jgi:hypothetical protein